MKGCRKHTITTRCINVRNRPPNSRSGRLPSKPKVVKQRNLALTGNVTQARLVELLEANYPYTSCMVDTEMETVLSMFSQDFGKYNDVLNKVVSS